jgi:hypothetical protein
VQILSITCDNATNNDTMIDELEALLTEFPGPANRTRCFAHIINLIAKSVIRQFDVPKAREGETIDEAMTELRALAGDIDVEEMLARAANSNEGEDEEHEHEHEDEDGVEGWVDERQEMSEVEVMELDADVQPVRMMLVKVGPVNDGV